MNEATAHGNMVIGVFDDDEAAQEAIRDLKSVGFDEDHIGVASRHEPDANHDMTFVDGSERTAALGAAVGLGTGALWGIGVLVGFLPGIGPTIAGGTLGVLLANAAVGGAAGGLAGALVGLGVPEQHADEYERECIAGKTIVTVKAGDRADTASAILSRNASHV